MPIYAYESKSCFSSPILNLASASALTATIAQWRVNAGLNANGSAINRDIFIGFREIELSSDLHDI
jgi:hypothetical protein